MLFQLLLVFMVALLTKKWFANLKYRHLPGPSPLLSLPLVGHGYLLGSQDPTAELTKMQKKYGDLFRLDIGNLPTVILCTYDQIKSAYTKEKFSGRTFNDNQNFKEIYPKDEQGNSLMGVVHDEGPVWSDQRRFMLKSLSDLGMGKKDTMQEVIEQEAEQVIELMTKCKENEINAKGLFLPAANNVIWRISTGKRSRQDDPELLNLTKCVSDFLLHMEPGAAIELLQMNSLAFSKLRALLKLPNLLTSAEKIVSLISETVGKSSADENGNYIEKALHEGEKPVGNGDNKSCSASNARGYIAAQMFDLFLAGTDTTAAALEWMILYLVKFPDVQEKVYQEIQALTYGGEKSITLQDKAEAHYTNAFLEEVKRHCPMGFLPLPHKTLEDAELDGKLIPKGTQLIHFQSGMNRDADSFPDPDTFNPERHLDKDGQFARNDRVVFFGIGKRRCPGELLARAELFLFVTNLVQRFKLMSVVDPEKLTYAAVPGLVFTRKECKFKIEERT